MKLARWHLRSVYVAGAALWLTGGAWLLTHYFLAAESAIGPLPHPLEPVWRMLHGVAAAAGLYAFGTLLVPHMMRSWSVGRSRVSGSFLAALFFFLAATGLGLYYVSDDAWREAIGLAHWIVGVGAPVLGAAHVALARRTRPAANGNTVPKARPGQSVR